MSIIVIYPMLESWWTFEVLIAKNTEEKIVRLHTFSVRF